MSNFFHTLLKFTKKDGSHLGPSNLIIIKLNGPDLMMTTKLRSNRGLPFGIGFPSPNDRVTELCLPCLQLSGRLSERISELRMLRKISLHSNSFNGTIPSSRSKCMLLRSVFFQRTSSAFRFSTSCKTISLEASPANSLSASKPSTSRQMLSSARCRAPL